MSDPPRRLRLVAFVLATALMIPTVPATAGAQGPPAQPDRPILPAGAPVPVTYIEQTPAGPRVRREFVATARAAHVRVAQLRGSNGVQAAEVDGLLYALETDPKRGRQWGLDVLRAERAWRALSASGVEPAKGRVIAVLDTGVDRRHEDLRGIVLKGRSFVRDGRRGDPNGHGTHVAGVAAAVTGNGIGVAGMAPGAQVLPVRILREDGSGSFSKAAKAIIWAADNGADVINLSAGSPIYSDVVAKAIRYAVRRRGVVVVAAGGNAYHFGNPTIYPAALPTTLSVGAVRRKDDRLVRAGFSSTGDWLDLVAPGQRIYSTWPGNYCPSPEGFRRYCRLTGTSMAAPFVSGAVALFRTRRPRLSPRKVRAWVTFTSRDLGPMAHDEEYGHGVVNPVALSRALPRFDDIAGHRFGSGIRNAAAARVMRRCDEARFCPDRRVRRAEMAVTVKRMLRLRGKGGDPYDDVAAGTPTASAINRIVARGIMRPCDTDRFCPGRRVKRRHAAVILLRALELSGSDRVRFNDVPEGSPGWRAINRIAGKKILRACGTRRFCPKDPLRRGQLAGAMRKALGL